MGPGQLDGIRVLDLSTWRPGPYCTQLLAEWGADVLRVERPGGDPMRVFPDLYATLNRRKRRCELDLKDPAGVAAVTGLSDAADVLVEGFRPGVLARLGLGPDVLRGRNPRLVYCSISGFGNQGPLAAASGHDINYQGWAGLLRGQPGRDVTLPVADLAAGVFAAGAVCAALVGRARTGEGETIDVSMADILASWSAPAAGGDLAAANVAGRAYPSYGVFACADGKEITLGVVAEDHFWRALCEILGMDDAADLTASERAAQGPTLGARVEAACAARPRDELLGAMLDAGVPASPVNTRDEVLANAHFRERGTITVSPEGTVLVGHPIHMAERPSPRADDAPEAGPLDCSPPRWA